jgi:cell division protein FtsB
VTSRDKKSTKGAATQPSLLSRLAAQAFSRARQFWDGPGRIGAIALGSVLAIAAAYSLVIAPMRSYFSQRSMVADKTAEFETLADANEQLQIEINKLNTPEGIRNAARAQLGYVLPGEQRLSLVKMPELPTDLPAQWPYSMVTNILQVRAEVAAKSGGPLSPLAP